MARKIIPVFIILALLLTSCNLSRTLDQQKQDLENLAVQGTTMAIIMTQGAASTEEPADTPQLSTDTAPAPATETVPPPTPTNTETLCTLKMDAIDVTIMDGTLIYVGEVFDKTWRLTNIGTCTWSADYKLIFSSGDQMEGLSPVPLGMTVAPNQQVDVSVKLVAPDPIDTYRGYWKLISPEDQAVGTVWVEIQSILAQPTIPPIPDWLTLETGDTGFEVTALQHLLNEYGQTVGIDGVFGNQTRTAVINIQTIAGITADGIVGKKTWKVLVSEMELYKGNSGNGVYALQKLLKNKFGYSLTIDGVYGNATFDAVKAFQQNWYLDPDGLVDPITWQALIGGTGTTY